MEKVEVEKAALLLLIAAGRAVFRCADNARILGTEGSHRALENAIALAEKACGKKPEPEYSSGAATVAGIYNVNVPEDEINENSRGDAC